jgi:hypothetical protein
MAKWSRLRAVLDWVFPCPSTGLRTRKSLYVRLYPELAVLDSAEERARVLRASNTEVLRGHKRQILGVACIACLLLLSLCYFLSKTRMGLAFAPIAAAFLAWAAILAIFWILHKPIRRSLRRQLRQQGVPICVECGYDLQGNESGRCPECGTPVRGREKAKPDGDQPRR